MNGICEMNVHTTALIRHSVTAKTRTRTLPMGSVSNNVDARDYR
jgi:hypothetical protein